MKNGLPPVWLNRRFTAAPSSASRPTRAATSSAASGRRRPPRWISSRVASRRRSASRRAIGPLASASTLAVGGDHQQRRSGAAAQDLAQQQHRGDVGPVQVLEHQQEPVAVGGVEQQPDHRLEELVAESLVLVATRGRGGRTGRAELGNQARQRLGAGLRQPDLLGQGRAVRGVVPQCLDERLVRRHALLVAAPVQDDGAVAVHRGGESRHQARLADAGLAGAHHQAALVARGLVPARLQPSQRGGAAYERSLLRPREDAGHRDLAERRGEGTHRDGRRSRTDLRTVSFGRLREAKCLAGIALAGGPPHLNADADTREHATADRSFA